MGVLWSIIVNTEASVLEFLSDFWLGRQAFLKIIFNNFKEEIINA
jgi:hypothetical protein